MHPTVSKAELQIFQALSALNLTYGMVTQQPIHLKTTIPDYLWPEKHIAIYLDGDQVHKEGDEWDQEVETLLEKRGWQVLRIRYHAPLTQSAKVEITRQIAEFIGGS
jgi:very-short-patch-repair endonuclease